LPQHEQIVAKTLAELEQTPIPGGYVRKQYEKELLLLLESYIHKLQIRRTVLVSLNRLAFRKRFKVTEILSKTAYC
jgi:hypothetical protein